MGVLQNIFPLPDLGADESARGNLIISGSGEAGGDMVYYNILRETLAAGRLLVIFDGKQTREEKNLVVNMLTEAMRGGRLGFLLNEDDPAADAVDPLTAFSTLEQKADYLARLMVLSGVDPADHDRLVMYYSLILEHFAHGSRRPSVKDLLRIDPDTAMGMIYSDTAFDAYQKRNAEILMPGMRSLYETKMIGASMPYVTGAMAKILNGSRSMNQVMRSGNAVVISAPASGFDEKRRCRLLHALAGLISMCVQNERYPVTVIFRHCDFLPEAVFTDILQLNSAYNSLSVWFPDDISGFVSKNGSEVMGLIPCRAVFRTEDINTALFWEQQAGQRERTDWSVSISQGNSRWPFGGNGGTGGFINAGGFNPDLAGNGAQAVNMGRRIRPNMPAERFRTLTNKQVICLNARTGRCDIKTLS